MLNIIFFILFKIFYFQDVNIDIQGRQFALTYLKVGSSLIEMPVILTTYSDKLTLVNIPGSISYDINNSTTVNKTSDIDNFDYYYLNNQYNISSQIVQDNIEYKNKSYSFYFGYSTNLDSINFAKEIRFPELGFIGISKNNNNNNNNNDNDKYNFMNQLIEKEIIKNRFIYFEKFKNGTTFRTISLGYYPEKFKNISDNDSNIIFECKMNDTYKTNRICKSTRIIFGSFNTSEEFKNNSIIIDENIDFTYNTNNYHIFPIKYKEIFENKIKDIENCSYVNWYYYSLWACENKENFPKISLVINHTIINMHNILFENLGIGYPYLIILFKDIDKIELSVQQMVYKGFSVLFDDENDIIKFISNNTGDIIHTDYDNDDDKKKDPETNYLIYFIIVFIIIIIFVIIDFILINKKPKTDIDNDLKEDIMPE